MTVRRTTVLRTTTVLLGITAATLTGAGSATALPDDGASVVQASGDEPVRDDASADEGYWPRELTEHTRLFTTPYRSYLVTMRDGEPTLVRSTGWDSCWFMTQHHGVRQYPC